MGNKIKAIFQELIVIALEAAVVMELLDMAVFPAYKNLTARWEPAIPNLVLVLDQRGRVMSNLPFRIQSAATGAAGLHVTNQDGLAAVPGLSAGEFLASLPSMGKDAEARFTRESGAPAILVVRVAEAAVLSRPRPRGLKNGGKSGKPPVQVTYRQPPG
jgi:hypothetical protein